MHGSTRSLPLALACLVACGDTGKTSDAGTDGSSSTHNASTGPASTSSASTASTDNSGSGGGTEGQTTSASTTASTSSSSTTNTTANTTGEPGTTTDATGGSTSTTGSTGPDTTGMTGNNTTGGACAGQGQTCAMGEMCCDGLECCAGVPVPMGKEFCSNNCPISDRNAKADFRPVDVQDVLARVVALDITTWRYKKDTADVRHLGPMAQDFKAAFGLGDTDKMIFPLDATGVSMAAIQALHQRLAAAQAENDDLRGRLGRLERRLADLEAR